VPRPHRHPTGQRRPGPRPTPAQRPRSTRPAAPARAASKPSHRPPPPLRPSTPPSNAADTVTGGFASGPAGAAGQKPRRKPSPSSARPGPGRAPNSHAQLGPAPHHESPKPNTTPTTSPRQPPTKAVERAGRCVQIAQTASFPALAPVAAPRSPFSDDSSRYGAVHDDPGRSSPLRVWPIKPPLPRETSGEVRLSADFRAGGRGQ